MLHGICWVDLFVIHGIITKQCSCTCHGTLSHREDFLTFAASGTCLTIRCVGNAVQADAAEDLGHDLEGMGGDASEVTAAAEGELNEAAEEEK